VVKITIFDGHEKREKVGLGGTIPLRGICLDEILTKEELSWIIEFTITYSLELNDDGAWF
jgi:hypothetical protein